MSLFSLDKHGAIPVDTHVWQLTQVGAGGLMVVVRAAVRDARRSTELGG